MTEYAAISDTARGSAFTSGNMESGPQVLSCGSPTNGIDVADFLNELKEVVDASWEIDVDLGACGAQERAVFDMLAPGEDVALCFVKDSRTTVSGYVDISVLGGAPFFDIVLRK